jgi:hypothetical protein
MVQLPKAETPLEMLMPPLLKAWLSLMLLVWTVWA